MTCQTGSVVRSCILQADCFVIPVPSGFSSRSRGHRRWRCRTTLRCGNNQNQNQTGERHAIIQLALHDVTSCCVTPSRVYFRIHTRTSRTRRKPPVNPFDLISTAVRRLPSPDRQRLLLSRRPPNINEPNRRVSAAS